ncbi:MAG TPA: hypothetical protein VFJ29_03870, partial [Candidatus Kapabacteria bacterium]|nr:hypothetical protein [Candidatus Kapabacteria bacterium]
NDAADMSISVSRSIKDPKATAVCKAITDNCHTDATDAAAHPFSPAEAIRRAQNIIRDAKTLDETFPGNTSLAASVESMLEEKVIVPNLLNDPSMDDIKAMMAQKNVTNVAFGATNDNAFAQMDGGTVTINATLGDEPPAVLKYFIALALNSGGASTLEGMYAQNELTGTLLLKSGGSRINTRADISIDMKTLGEQESKRLLHAMPAYANTADH